MLDKVGKLLCALLPPDDPDSLQNWRLMVVFTMFMVATAAIADPIISWSRYGFATQDQYEDMDQKIFMLALTSTQARLDEIRTRQCLAIRNSNGPAMDSAREELSRLKQQFWNLTHRPWEEPECEEIIADVASPCVAACVID